ncbi:GIY-YIG nuclease family protein [Agrococcus sp. ARC_14]|uniref:GIY-YIG nuclease family protein n=1 Tax=Agrococcus sp. ARC_14 TaxID=2919927 RepID=UPI001F0567AA|nr:GIY-YIG nuclease family protein [Agrococcus sp. ARC_14]MCH1883779.1 GIY-YIG nuclease family protein [Agrococcus sp. ARC_14]
MPWVYMLRCADGSFYVGSTRDIERRLDQHQSGAGAVYTKRRLPVELVFAHHDDSVAAAFALEKQIQGWSRAKREALIRGDFAAIAAAGKKRDWAGHRARRRAAEGSDAPVVEPPPPPVVE